MIELLQAIPFSFAALFPVVNPIGSSVIFMSIANVSSSQEIAKLATRVAIYVVILLTTVLLAGSTILRAFGITIPIVLIGGGLVLAYIGWQMLNQPSAPSTDNLPSTRSDKEADSMAFYPLTMPVTSGPGCIAVAIALGAHRMTGDIESTVLGEIGNSIGILLIGISVYICYRYTDSIARKLGSAGTQVIMRLAAFINLCIGLELMWHGIQYLK